MAAVTTKHRLVRVLADTPAYTEHDGTRLEAHWMAGGFDGVWGLAGGAGARGRRLVVHEFDADADRSCLWMYEARVEELVLLHKCRLSEVCYGGLTFLGGYFNQRLDFVVFCTSFRIFLLGVIGTRIMLLDSLSTFYMKCGGICLTTGTLILGCHNTHMASVRIHFPERLRL